MLQEVLIPAVVFGAIIIALKLILDSRLRNKLIDKGMVDENVKFLNYSTAQTQRLSSLKWGMVLISLGLALSIKFIWPDVINEEGTLGLMFLFAGIGFLVYFWISQQFIDNNKK